MAVESADVVMINDDIGVLSDLLSLSQRCRRRIQENIVLAVAIKIVFVGLALSSVLAKLWVAVLVDGVSVFLVLANSRRGLVNLKPPNDASPQPSEKDVKPPSNKGSNSAVDVPSAADTHKTLQVSIV